MKQVIIPLVLTFFIFSVCASTANAVLVLPLKIYTNNGSYYDSPDLDLFVEVEAATPKINFTIHNESLVASSIAQVYFDDDSLLANGSVLAGSGVLFNCQAAPQNIPAANWLEPPFETTYSFDANAPKASNGINPTDWLTVQFDLAGGATFTNVTDALYNGSFRIGIHLIGLPDGSSEGGVDIPEPGTILLFGLGAAILKKRKR